MISMLLLFLYLCKKWIYIHAMFIILFNESFLHPQGQNSSILYLFSQCTLSTFNSTSFYIVHLPIWKNVNYFPPCAFSSMRGESVPYISPLCYTNALHKILYGLSLCKLIWKLVKWMGLKSLEFPTNFLIYWLCDISIDFLRGKLWSNNNKIHL